MRALRYTQVADTRRRVMQTAWDLIAERKAANFDPDRWLAARTDALGAAPLKLLRTAAAGTVDSVGPAGSDYQGACAPERNVDDGNDIAVTVRLDD